MARQHACTASSCALESARRSKLCSVKGLGATHRSSTPWPISASDSLSAAHSKTPAQKALVNCKLTERHGLTSRNAPLQEGGHKSVANTNRNRGVKKRFKWTTCKCGRGCPAKRGRGCRRIRVYSDVAPVSQSVTNSTNSNHQLSKRRLQREFRRLSNELYLLRVECAEREPTDDDELSIMILEFLIEKLRIDMRKVDSQP